LPRISLSSVDLPAPFGPIKPKPIAAHDPQRQIADQRTLRRNALVTMRRARRRAARALAGVERKLHVAEPCAALAALAPQRVQPAHAAFVACPACLDPLAYPGFLLRPEPVELSLRNRFGGELVGLPRFVGAEVAG
jgi:hypothetical protein